MRQTRQDAQARGDGDGDGDGAVGAAIGDIEAVLRAGAAVEFAEATLASATEELRASGEETKTSPPANMSRQRASARQPTGKGGPSGRSDEKEAEEEGECGGIVDMEPFHRALRLVNEARTAVRLKRRQQSTRPAVMAYIRGRGGRSSRHAM